MLGVIWLSPWSPANNWHCFWVRFRALKRIVVFRAREVRPHNFFGDSCLQDKSISYQTTTLRSLKRDTGLSLRTFLAGCIGLHWARYIGVKIPNERPVSLFKHQRVLNFSADFIGNSSPFEGNGAPALHPALLAPPAHCAHHAQCQGDCINIY